MIELGPEDTEDYCLAANVLESTSVKVQRTWVVAPFEFLFLSGPVPFLWGLFQKGRGRHVKLRHYRLAPFIDSDGSGNILLRGTGRKKVEQILSK